MAYPTCFLKVYDTEPLIAYKYVSFDQKFIQLLREQHKHFWDYLKLVEETFELNQQELFERRVYYCEEVLVNNVKYFCYAYNIERKVKENGTNIFRLAVIDAVSECFTFDVKVDFCNKKVVLRPTCDNYESASYVHSIIGLIEDCLLCSVYSDIRFCDFLLHCLRRSGILLSFRLLMVIDKFNRYYVASNTSNVFATL